MVVSGRDGGNISNSKPTKCLVFMEDEGASKHEDPRAAIAMIRTAVAGIEGTCGGQLTSILPEELSSPRLSSKHSMQPFVSSVPSSQPSLQPSSQPSLQPTTSSVPTVQPSIMQLEPESIERKHQPSEEKDDTVDMPPFSIVICVTNQRPPQQEAEPAAQKESSNCNYCPMYSSHCPPRLRLGNYGGALFTIQEEDTWG